MENNKNIEIDPHKQHDLLIAIANAIFALAEKLTGEKLSIPVFNEDSSQLKMWLEGGYVVKWEKPKDL